MVEVKSLVLTESVQLKLSSGKQIQQAGRWMGETVSADAAAEFVTEWVVPSLGGLLVGA